MTASIHLRLGSDGIALHVAFEALAYFVAFQVYRCLRKKVGDPLSQDHRWWIIAAAAFGAAIGSRFLGFMQDSPAVFWSRSNPTYLSSGKSIVGALVGGWIGVEWIKRRLGVTVSTGDLFAAPLAVGIAIGRIGCFLAGLPDHTYGTATTLPWGIDFGDGVYRHPTQVYEMVFLLTFLIVLLKIMQRYHRSGDVFRLFMAGYMTWRFIIDFWKPDFRLLGVTPIQWTCLFVAFYYLRDIPRIIQTFRNAAADSQLFAQAGEGS